MNGIHNYSPLEQSNKDCKLERGGVWGLENLRRLFDYPCLRHTYVFTT